MKQKPTTYCCTWMQAMIRLGVFEYNHNPSNPKVFILEERNKDDEEFLTLPIDKPDEDSTDDEEYNIIPHYFSYCPNCGNPITTFAPKGNPA